MHPISFVANTQNYYCILAVCQAVSQQLYIFNPVLQQLWGRYSKTLCQCAWKWGEFGNNTVGACLQRAPEKWVLWSPLLAWLSFPDSSCQKGFQLTWKFLDSLPLGFKFPPDIGLRMVHMDVAAGVDNCHQLVHTVVPYAQISRLGLACLDNFITSHLFIQTNISCD